MQQEHTAGARGKEKNIFGQVVLRTGLLTLYIAVVTLGYGAAVLGFVIPKTMADLCSSIGAHNSAAMYYERIYNANKTSENLYMVLDKYTAAENRTKVIYYSDMLIKRNDYNAIINKVNLERWKSSTSKHDYILSCNEDNRVKYVYITYLLQENKTEKAKELFTGWLDGQIYEPDATNPPENSAPSLNPVKLASPLHAYFAFLAADESNDAGINTTMDKYYRKFIKDYTDSKENAEGSPVLSVNDSITALDFIITFGGYFLSTQTTEDDIITQSQLNGYITEFKGAQWQRYTRT